MHHPLLGEGDDFMRIGGIGSISSPNSMQATQISASDLKDQKSKNLQDDITDVQREIQKLSSESDLSVSEKAEKKEKLQEEKSSLDTKLKLHQDELLKSQKREIKLAELQEDRKPEKEEDSEDSEQKAETTTPSDETDEKKLSADDRHSLQPGTVITQNSDGTVILKEILNQAAGRDTDTENKQADETKEKAASEKEEKDADADTVTDTGLSEREVQAMISADTSMQQADRQGMLVSKTTGDIAVLEGEIKQDAYRDIDTERKQAELKNRQAQSEREMTYQFSLLNEANTAMPKAAETNASTNSAAQTERTFQVSGVNASQEDQALQQGFQVSIA